MTSYLAYKRQMKVLDVAEENIERWITVRGNHIPVLKGQSEEQAINNFTERKRAEKGLKTHEEQYKKITEKVELYKKLAKEGQEKLNALYKDFESYQKDPELKKLAWENNANYKLLGNFTKLQEKEKKYIKKYRDMLNQLDNSENKIENTGVAKVISFGKMPLERAKEAVANVKAMQEKYPFMKGKLDYIGTQDSEEFKKWYKEDIIDWAVTTQIYKIQQHIQNCRDLVAKGKPASESVWDEIRYNNAVKTVKEVDEIGEDAYARRWAEANYSTTKRFSKNTWAYYISKNDRSSGVIVFNSQNYDTHGRESGDFHPVGCNTPKSVLDHEFGHSVYFELELDKPFANAKDSPLGKLRDFLVVEYSGGSKESIRKNLSLYAATNMSEFFAEAFAEYQNNPEPRRIAKTVGEYLEEYKKELADGTHQKRIEKSVNNLIGEKK
jgi:hypothetical protein